VKESRDEFNEIFKGCVRKIAGKLSDCKTEGSASAEDCQNMSKNALSRDYEALFSGMICSDVELEVEGKTLKAHKLVLMSKISGEETVGNLNNSNLRFA
jgi:hypothetical protein